MTTLTDSSLRHVRTLEAHGAYIITESGSVPVTPDFCQNALAGIARESAIVSYNYDMGLPGIDGEFALIINRDGTVESGSRETVEDLLWRR